MSQATRNTLLCFDAFGTLFKPRQPIYAQYGEIARKYGVDSFTDDELEVSFKRAFKVQQTEHPNYGKASGMGTEKWWTNVVQNTFQPLLLNINGKPTLPPALAPALIQRFRSREGYEMYPDAYKLLKSFGQPDLQQTWRRGDRMTERAPKCRLVIGLVSNSDDRVMDILPSLGIVLKPLRYGADVAKFHPTNNEADVDFAVLSYDVGAEKPAKRVFDSALDMLQRMLSVEGNESLDLDEWRTVYVGDDPEKDARGAADAGWEAILVDRLDDDRPLYPGNSAVHDLEPLVETGRVKLVHDLGRLPELLG